MVGSFRNLTFLPVIIGNTLIGIVQELRAKKTLDTMKFLSAPHSDVIRDGELQNILSEELVKDDIILLKAGKQICADALVISGSIQVNESLLTGESDEIEKAVGSKLLSGSFVVSGECYARLEKVGDESYISKLSTQAKTMKSKEQSEMIRHINLIVKAVGIVIIPIGAVLFLQSFYVNGDTLRKSVTSTVAAVLGMIPEGLYLLTTVALALSTMKLATKKVLLHDMKSIETLARVDVLCVDKTGTITEPDMKVEDVFLYKGANSSIDYSNFEKLLFSYALASKDNNATMQALKEYANALAGAVLHCYNASPLLLELHSIGQFYYGIGGVLTFKNAKKTKETVKRIGLENIVLETDSPYLAPVPFRGKRNDSGNIKYIVEEIAGLLGISKEKVIETTFNNAVKLYELEDKAYVKLC